MFDRRNAPFRHVRITGDEALDLWKRACQSSNDATYFHTPSWAEVISATFPRWLSDPLVLHLPTGNVMVLPQMRRALPGGLLCYGESMPPGVYGGPLFLHPPCEEDWLQTWSAVQRLPNRVVYVNPFQKIVGAPKGMRRPLYTHFLELDRGFDRIWKGYRQGHRRNVRAALKNGLEVKVADAISEINTYYEIYRDSLNRWGKRAGGFYPLRLFQLLFHHPQYGDAIKLLIALFRGKVIAGAWTLCHKDHAVYWHGAVLSDHMQRRAPHLLLSAAIESACKACLRWFDFNPSGGFTGVEHFKEGFGAQRREFFVYRRLGAMGRAFRLYKHTRERYFGVCGL